MPLMTVDTGPLAGEPAMTARSPVVPTQIKPVAAGRSFASEGVIARIADMVVRSFSRGAHHGRRQLRGRGGPSGASLRRGRPEGASRERTRAMLGPEEFANPVDRGPERTLVEGLARSDHSDRLGRGDEPH